MARIRIQHATKRGIKIKTVYSSSQLVDFIKKCHRNGWRARALVWILFPPTGQFEIYECGAVWDHEEAGLSWFADNDMSAES